MHQDQRVGLALGVLLVGACAAFFFRNETHSSTQAPQLQHAQELDDRIAERSTRPYLRGIQAVETADKRPGSQLVDPAHALEDQDDAFYNTADSSDGKFSGTRSPRFMRPGAKLNDNPSEIPEMAPIAIHADPSDSNSRSGSPSDVTTHQSPADRTYVVQKGDTLSSIAARTLGNSSRFQDLFDANQDQLHDPNDVRVGMTLRIPDGRPGTTRSPSQKPQNSLSREPEPFYVPSDILNDSAPPGFEANSAPSDRRSDAPATLLPPDVPSNRTFEPPADTDIQDDGNSSKRFVPARRVPLPGRPAGPQASNTRLPEQRGRKLSQVSLESTSGKVAR